jgi:ipoprotein LpqH
MTMARVGGVLTILVVALAGCSTAKTSGPGAPAAVAVGSASPAQATNGAPGPVRVMINGQDADAGNTVACSDEHGVTTITIGEGARGATVVVADDAAHTVNSIGIGDLGGVSMGYFKGEPVTAPTVTRSGSSYTVTGSGRGTPTSDSTTTVDVTYEIAATCP